jgi:hypothetical protein
MKNISFNLITIISAFFLPNEMLTMRKINCNIRKSVNRITLFMDYSELIRMTKKNNSSLALTELTKYIKNLLLEQGKFLEYHSFIIYNVFAFLTRKVVSFINTKMIGLDVYSSIEYLILLDAIFSYDYYQLPLYGLHINKNLGKQELDLFTNIFKWKTLRELRITILTEHSLLTKLIDNISLLSLSISCPLQEDGLNALNLLLERTVSIKKINLFNLNIKPEGMHLLSSGIKLNSSLSYIDLSCNSIGDEGALYFSNALRDSSELQILQLRKNNISDEGAREIFENLKLLKFLRELNFAHNLLNLAKNIYYFLTCNETISRIYLNNNRINFEGGKIIFQSLLKNKSLILLDISNNHLTKHSAQYITDYLKTDSPLQRLDIIGNGYHSEDIKLIIEGLSVNTQIKTLCIERYKVDDCLKHRVNFRSNSL